MICLLQPLMEGKCGTQLLSPPGRLLFFASLLSDKGACPTSADGKRAMVPEGHQTHPLTGSTQPDTAAAALASMLRLPHYSNSVLWFHCVLTSSDGLGSLFHMWVLCVSNTCVSNTCGGYRYYVRQLIVELN